MHHGVLIVDKPAGMTSSRVVGHVKRAADQKKVGHTGTLDPLATGVLPICLGEATKIAGYLLADDKRYTAELVLGVETDTLDRDGQVVARDPDGAAAVTEMDLRRALEARVGDGMQTPPMYSALKRDGRPLYELARKGVTVERPPRPVRIDALALLSFEPPRARIDVTCSKGTYIRSLVADVGRDVGCGAHVSELRRTRSGAFDESRAIALEDLDGDSVAKHLIPAADVLPHTAVQVPETEIEKIGRGLRLRWDQVSQDAEIEGLFMLVGPQNRLLALATLDDGLLRYARVFVYAD